MKNDNFEQSHSAKKFERGGPFGIFKHPFGFILLHEVLRFAVCFGQTEQMSKKVDLTRVKKLPTVSVGHIFY